MRLGNDTQGGEALVTTDESDVDVTLSLKLRETEHEFLKPCSMWRMCNHG